MESQRLSQEHSLSCVSVRFSIDGRLLASAGADKSCCVYDVHNKTLLTRLADCHSAGLNDCVWVDNQYLLTACDDGFVRVIDIEANKMVQSWKVSKVSPYSLAVNHSNHLVSTGDTDGYVTSFAIGVKDTIQRIHAHSSVISSLTYTSVGMDELLTASHDGILRQWIPQQSARCIRSIVPTPKAPVPIACAVYAPNSQYFVVSSLDSTMRLYHRDFFQLAKPQETVLSIATHIKQYTGHQSCKYSSGIRMVARPDSSFAVLGGDDNGDLFLWDANAQSVLVHESAVHTGAVLGLDVFEDLVATSGADGLVKLHRLPFSDSESKMECS